MSWLVAPQKWSKIEKLVSFGNFCAKAVFRPELISIHCVLKFEILKFDFRSYSAIKFGGQNRGRRLKTFVFGRKFRPLVYHWMGAIMQATRSNFDTHKEFYETSEK